MQRPNFDKFLESDIIHRRLVYVARQENLLGIRERIDKEFSALINELMSNYNLSYDNIGMQVLALWQGYTMALATMDVLEE